MRGCQEAWTASLQTLRAEVTVRSCYPLHRVSCRPCHRVQAAGNETLLNACCMRTASRTLPCPIKSVMPSSHPLTLIACFWCWTGPSTEGSALPASTKMSSEYDLFDITSAMDWYEGDGGLLGSKVQPRLPEDPFQQELLQGLNAFSAEEQQPSEPAWCSKGLSSSYEISRTSAASTMIPTDFSMERRHPSGR